MGKITVPTGEEFPEKAAAVIIGGGIAETATAFWLSMTELAVERVEIYRHFPEVLDLQEIELALNPQGSFFYTDQERSNPSLREAAQGHKQP